MATKGIPSIPDVPLKLTEPDVYAILEPLKRIIDIRQGKFDPLDRWVTQQDLIDAGIQTEGAVESPIIVVPPTQSYPFNLTGDILGGPTTMGTGSATFMATAINLPNVVCIDGGDAASTYPGQATGPFGVVSSGVEVQDEGSSLTLDLTKMNFVGAGVTVTEPVADEMLITISGGGGAGGNWEEITGSPFTPTATQTFNVTWDETLYGHVKMVIEDIRTNDDNSLFGIRLGSSNGAVIHASAGNYQTHEIEYVTGGWTHDGGNNHIPLADNWGSVASEGLWGEINIIGGSGNGTSAALISADVHYNINTGPIAARSVKSLLKVDAAIDTVQFRMTTGGDAFQVEGLIRVYGQIL
jgi:hypothetical protein